MNFLQKLKQHFDVGYYLAYLKNNDVYIRKLLKEKYSHFNIQYSSLSISNSFSLVKYNDIVVYEEGITFRYGDWTNLLKEFQQLVKEEKELNFSEL